MVQKVLATSLVEVDFLAERATSSSSSSSSATSRRIMSGAEIATMNSPEWLICPKLAIADVAAATALLATPLATLLTALTKPPTILFEVLEVLEVLAATTPASS